MSRDVHMAVAATLVLLLAACVTDWRSVAEAASTATADPPVVNPPQVRHATTYQGTILLIAGDRLALRMDKEPKVFAVRDDAVIMLNGDESDLDHLQPGYLATVLAEPQRDELVARIVDARLLQ